ncbi:MAG TPA: AAA family ATPase [Dissulfurispiraceae bacterium]|nr:AAA family ATPase [Dissulfurispiraceae bacterium]
MTNDYPAYFQLTDDPFRIPPDPHYYFPSERHTEILSSLNYAVEQKEGFFLATGEPGTGKTTLLKVFIDNWRERAEIALVMTPRLAPQEFLAAILEDLKVTIDSTNKHDVIKAFRNFLIATTATGKRVIIIVDEVQNLPDDTLEELRLLSNLETEKEKLLQIVLFGQPEFRDRVLSPSLRQLNQRITVRATLPPLSRSEMMDYLQYRLMKAGASSVPFDEKSRNRLYMHSRGIPRLVNLIASRALMAAFVDGSRIVQEKHVLNAITHLEDSPQQSSPFGMKMLLTGAAVVLALVIGIAFVYNNFGTSSALTPVSAADQASSVATQQQLPPAENLVISAERANLRRDPDMHKPVVIQALKGARYPVMASRKDDGGRLWYRIRTKEYQDLWVRSDMTIKVTE